jgi:amidase
MATIQDHPSGGPRRLLSTIPGAVRAGQTSARAILEECLAAVAEHNPRLNALVALRADEARVEADALDALSPAELRDKPLAGVPFTVKDVIATQDLPTTCGSRIMAGFRPAEDASAVVRLRAAGAILVGKSNTPEFAFSIDTENELFGRTGNPLGDLTAGGSSGGEAAALASGMSLLGIGSDFGGSIRWPAQCAGVVGLRPTIGRLPATGLLPTLTPERVSGPNLSTLQGRVQTLGPMAATVGDIELALAVMSGPDGSDPRTLGIPPWHPSDVDLTRVEIRYGTGAAGQEADPAVAAGVESAVVALAGAGVGTAVGLPPEVDEAVEVYARLREADPLVEVSLASRGREQDLVPFTRDLLARAPRHSVELADLWAERERLTRGLLNWLTGDRALVLPIASTLPHTIDELLSLEAGVGFDSLLCSRAIALFGVPALSVPVGQAPDGRPVSVQVVGPPFREDVVLALGRRLERAFA